jgi:hypothetical protein
MANMVDLKDSNIANVGGEGDHDAHRKAALTDKNWDGCGKEKGVEVWRVENVRNKDGSPNFGICRWPKSEYGSFCLGDSYIVLNTKADENTGKLSWNAHFWIGPTSSQDEYVVATYKVIELDDILGGNPVLYRETKGNESKQFMSCFDGQIAYLSGGIDSGFRHAEPLKYEPRLFQVRKTGRHVRSYQVPLERKSLNHGDCFVLDNGKIVYTWFGDSSSAFEKNKAARFAFNIVQSRDGHANQHEGRGDAFWNLLGGEGDIAAAVEREPYPKKEEVKTRVFHLTDEDSVVRTNEVAASIDSLKSVDTYCVDVGNTIFVWIGHESTKREKQEAFTHAHHMIKLFDKPKSTRIIRCLQGQEKQVGFFKKTGFAEKKG